MRRKVFFIAAVILAVSLLSLCAYAERGPRLVDDAGLLDYDEFNDLTSRLDRISENQQIDVVIVTVDSTGNRSLEEYADDYFDYNGYGYGEDYDGVILVLDMGRRDWWISTCGYGIYALTDAGISRLGDMMLDDLRYGDYYDAFVTFAEGCDTLFTRAKEGNVYDDYVIKYEKEPYNVFGNLILSLIIGFVVALIIVSAQKKGLKGAVPVNNAMNYVRNGSMNVTVARDLFLYKTVTFVVRQSSSSSGSRSGGSHTHTSSSGRTHGGGGGHF